MAVTKEIINSYENYGRCVKISNGTVEAYVTIDVGPRVIRYAFVGGENVLFNDIARRSKRMGPDYDNYYYKGAAWYLYGGHRLWITPESAPETYYPDNEEVKFEYTDNGAVFTPNAQIKNDIQMQIEVVMADSGTDTQIIHRVTNLRKENLEFSMWGITVLGRSGLEIIPQNNHSTALLPNRTLSIWPYTNVTDERFYFGKDYITLRQNPEAKGAFKIGTDNNHGMAAYVINGNVFVCKYDHSHPDAKYPDGGVSFETYTDDNVLEMETLSKIENVKPNETASHSVCWSLFKTDGCPDAKDEKAIAEFMNKIV